MEAVGLADAAEVFEGIPGAIWHAPENSNNQLTPLVLRNRSSPPPALRHRRQTDSVAISAVARGGDSGYFSCAVRTSMLDLATVPTWVAHGEASK
jgi:hypothetical protein